jgi:hypothetical protein
MRLQPLEGKPRLGLGDLFFFVRNNSVQYGHTVLSDGDLRAGRSR